MVDRDIEEFGFEWHEILHLDDDEQEHLNQVSREVEKFCVLAKEGGLLAASCVGWTPTLEKAEISSPVFITALLVMKCANLLRLSTTAILTGYYAGVAVLLRAAYESLVYLHLFAEDPDEIGLWLRPDLHPSLDPMERYRLRREQFNRGRNSFHHHAPDEQHERELVRLLWDKSSRHLHSSVIGLAQAFGLDYRDLLPDELVAQLDKSGDDWGFALDVLSFRASEAKKPARGKGGGRTYPKEEVRLVLTGRYDEEEALLLSRSALFLAHRLADLTFSLFKAADRELEAGFNRWRSEVRPV
jgi:hypothetical protein